MISNYPSVLFVTISLLVCFYLGLADELKLLILSSYIIFKCPTGELLLINDWKKFQSLNISCPNQVHLSNQSLDIFRYGSKYSECDAKNRSFAFFFNITLASSAKNNNNNITDEQLNLLSSTVIFGGHTHQFTTKSTDDSRLFILNKIVLEWNDRRFHQLRILFDKQPIACLVRLDFTGLIVNETCTNNDIAQLFICYNDPSSVSPLQNVNWTLLQDLVMTNKYLSNDWMTKGAFLYDPRLQTTTSTIRISTTDSTSMSSTDEATTMDTESTSTSSAEETSVPRSTTATTLSPDSTSSSIIDTASTVYTETTPITSADSTSATTTDVTTAEFKKITSSNSHKSKPVSKHVSKIKPQRNSSASRTTRVPKKASSSSNSLLLIFLLIIVICGIIGSVGFFVFRYYRKQHNENDQLLLDRVDSDESNRSEMDESEISTVMEAPPEIQNEPIPARNAGRTVNRFDLNEM